MISAFDNFPALLIWLPLLGGVLNFFIKPEGASRAIAILFSFLSLGVTAASICFTGQEHAALNQVSYVWLQSMGSGFTLILDGLTQWLCLLTALVFPLAYLSMPKGKYGNAHTFYGLMQLTQAGLFGVFMAADGLVFYLFWELALIPVYFLASMWGGEKRIKATFKFFIYTFLGSLFLLLGIIYMHLKTSNTSFGLIAMYNVQLTKWEEYVLFFMFFIAFAIKMPLFPLHTWQPDAYEQAPAPVTMVLSAVMVKMGVFGLIRWLIPMFPLAVNSFKLPVVALIVFGMIYASLIAIKQDSVKRLIAYSSIAHIGLMAAGAFTMNYVAMQGVVLQMFSHGVNILALWIVADIVERQTGATQISQLGGVAKKAPTLAIFLVIMVFANIALPLTNAFIGEFMIFSGLFKYNVWVAAFAGLAIILSAVYMLNFVKNVFYGEPAEAVAHFQDIKPLTSLVLASIVVLVFFIGIYPAPFFALFQEAAGLIITQYSAN